MREATAIMSLALRSVSGRPVTVEEAIQILSTMPYTARDLLFKYFKGSLDPHRMFQAPVLYSAPDAVTYIKQIQEEEEETDAKVDELEVFLTQKFGRKEVEEELEMGRRIVEGTGYAGAVNREHEYLESAKNSRYQELE
jgi:hypothetical protein